MTKTGPTIMCNPHAHPHIMKKTHAKFKNNWYKTVRGVALTTSTHCLYIQGENDFHNAEKVTKIDPTTMSNPHAHPHTIRKTHAKFENNWYKTVRGVALTRDTQCLYNQGEK